MPRMYDPRELPDDYVLQDGEGIRTRLDLCDGKPAPQHQLQDCDRLGRPRFASEKQLADHQAGAGFRPGYASAIRRWHVYDEALQFNVADAIAEKERIFDEESRRRDNAWRGGPALADKVPDPDENDEPDDDEEDDDDDDGGGGDDDADTGLAGAMRDKEAAYQEAVQRSQNAWKTMGGAEYSAKPLQPLDPTAADRTQAQGMAWRGGR